jgi:hypothetical protein
MLAMLAWSGLRAKEIPLATWSMVLDADGNVGDTLELHDKASKAPWHRRPWIVLVPFSHYRDGEVTGVELIAKYVSDDLAGSLRWPIYGWFTEGFDTPVLTDAKALLEQVQS